VLSITITGPSLFTADASATGALARGSHPAQWTATLDDDEAMTVLADGRVRLTQGLPAAG
jgi:thiamine biosynthesis lipoprotein ApbE